MRFSSFGFLGKSSSCAAALAAAVALTGCSEDPGLQERLSRLQAEMQEKDRQLQDARSALEKTKSELKTARVAATSKPVTADTPAPAPDAKSQFLSREQVEESYDSASKAMQKRVGGELRDYSLENCTQFPVTMPSDDYPYRSKVALTFRSDKGRAYRLEFPVSADTAGKWTFPNTVDIAGALADSRRQDQSNTATAGNPTPTGSPKVAQGSETPATASRTPASSSSQVVPGQALIETKVIDWGEGRSTPSSRSTPTPSTASNVVPTPQPSPQQSKAPTQSMSADKDVKIHW